MKSIRLLFFILLCSLAANAQEIKRIEIPIAGQLETFSIPLGEKGVIVLTQVGKSEFNIRKFNTNLEQVWMNQGSIEANLDFADPSDMGISCRQTGPISAADIAKIDKSKHGEVVFTESLSILFKTLKVRRIYDAPNQTLLYLSYSTKETNGSHKHALSTVPLYGSQAWVDPAISAAQPK